MSTGPYNPYWHLYHSTSGTDHSQCVPHSSPFVFLSYLIIWCPLCDHLKYVPSCLQDFSDANQLLGQANVDQEALLRYAHGAAHFSTGHRLPNMQFALNHAGQPDVAMFDFTCMHRAENASLVRERKGKKLLMGLVGDCLVEVRGHVHVMDDDLVVKCLTCSWFLYSHILYVHSVIHTMVH